VKILLKNKFINNIIFLKIKNNNNNNNNFNKVSFNNFIKLIEKKNKNIHIKVIKML
jgi:hypothetical protein